jgi:hypothetical protein
MNHQHKLHKFHDKGHYHPVSFNRYYQEWLAKHPQRVAETRRRANSPHLNGRGRP